MENPGRLSNSRQLLSSQTTALQLFRRAHIIKDIPKEITLADKIKVIEAKNLIDYIFKIGGLPLDSRMEGHSFAFLNGVP